MIEGTNLSNNEYYKLNGSLSSDRIEALLDLDGLMEFVSGTHYYLEEAQGQFPEEDFLCGVVNKLHKLADKLRGDNKAAVLDIVDLVFGALGLGLYMERHGYKSVMMFLCIIPVTFISSIIPSEQTCYEMALVQAEATHNTETINLIKSKLERYKL